MLPAPAVHPLGPGTVLDDRYELLGPLASGGMATVWLARARAASGFKRIVAIKALLPHLTADREFVSMFVDEARLVGLIHHPNVVATLDLGDGQSGTLYLVMEYVDGQALSQVLKEGRLPVSVVLRVVYDALQGLHAAHELKNDDGALLDVVHRDISPQNLIVGLDGITRVMDFGIAKARSRSSVTEEGVVKGKMAYMAPEQFSSDPVDRRADVFAMGIVLWELLTHQRLFRASSPQETIGRVLHGPIACPSEIDASLPDALDPIVLRALSRAPKERFASAQELGAAIARSGVAMAEPHEVAALIEERFGDTLRARRAVLLKGPESAATQLTNIPPTIERSAVQRIGHTAVTSRLHRMPRRLGGAFGVLALGLAAGLGVWAWVQAGRLPEADAALAVPSRPTERVTAPTALSIPSAPALVIAAVPDAGVDAPTEPVGASESAAGLSPHGPSLHGPSPHGVSPHGPRRGTRRTGEEAVRAEPTDRPSILPIDREEW